MSWEQFCALFAIVAGSVEFHETSTKRLMAKIFLAGNELTILTTEKFDIKGNKYIHKNPKGGSGDYILSNNSACGSGKVAFTI